MPACKILLNGMMESVKWFKKDVKEKRIMLSRYENVVHVPVILIVTILYGIYLMNYFVMVMLPMEIVIKDLIVHMALMKILIFVVKVIMHLTHF